MTTNKTATPIGYLIPEFPGQTHAFFMRERKGLEQLGTNATLYSTRPPVAAAAQHAWAEAAAKETIYLTPFRLESFVSAAFWLLLSGPFAIWRCCQTVLQSTELKAKEKLKILSMIPVAAFWLSHLKKNRSQHVHIHSCGNSAWLGVFVSQLSNITYSLTLHGPLHDYGPAQPSKWQHARFVVVITQDLVNEAACQIPQAQRPPIFLAPMGVDVMRFQRTVPYQPASQNQEVRLVSCGRINPCKGHDDLIRAVVMLRQLGVDVSLTICGSTDSQRQDYEQFLNQLIEDNGLQQCVRLTGSVSEDRVRQELQDAHFFCLASHKEPLGVATMEAMAMGVPVIVTYSPGVSEMITHDHDGLLVEAKHPQSFVDAIIDLLSNPAHVSQLASEARKTVETKFHSGISAEMIRSGIDADHRQLQTDSAELIHRVQSKPECDGATTVRS